MDPFAFQKFSEEVTRYNEASKKYKPVAEKWVKIARDDLEISKLLLENKHYASSVYHLEQFFEKLSKAYFVISGRILPEDAYEHRFTLEQTKKMIQDGTIEKIKDMMKQLPMDTKSAESLLNVNTKLLDILQKKEDELRLLTKEDFNLIFKLAENITNKLSNEHFITSVQKKVMIKKFQGFIRHIVFVITRFRVPYSAVKEMTSGHNVKKYVLNSVFSINLLLISLFTYVHWNTPRYPYDKYSKVVFDNYGDDMGIVKVLPEMHMKGEYLLDYFEKEFITTSAARN